MWFSLNLDLCVVFVEFGFLWTLKSSILAKIAFPKIENFPQIETTFAQNRAKRWIYELLEKKKKRSKSFMSKAKAKATFRKALTSNNVEVVSEMAPKVDGYDIFVLPLMNCEYWNLQNRGSAVAVDDDAKKKVKGCRTTALKYAFWSFVCHFKSGDANEKKHAILKIVANHQDFAKNNSELERCIQACYEKHSFSAEIMPIEQRLFLMGTKAINEKNLILSMQILLEKSVYKAKYWEHLLEYGRYGFNVVMEWVVQHGIRKSRVAEVCRIKAFHIINEASVFFLDRDAILDLDVVLPFIICELNGWVKLSNCIMSTWHHKGLLHHCCQMFYIERVNIPAIITKLLENGANPWSLDGNKMTPLDVLMKVEIKKTMQYHISPLKVNH